MKPRQRGYKYVYETTSNIEYNMAAPLSSCPATINGGLSLLSSLFYFPFKGSLEQVSFSPTNACLTATPTTTCKTQASLICSGRCANSRNYGFPSCTINTNVVDTPWTTTAPATRQGCTAGGPIVIGGVASYATNGVFNCDCVNGTGGLPVMCIFPIP